MPANRPAPSSTLAPVIVIPVDNATAPPLIDIPPPIVNEDVAKADKAGQANPIPAPTKPPAMPLNKPN